MEIYRSLAISNGTEGIHLTYNNRGLLAQAPGARAQGGILKKSRLKYGHTMIPRILYTNCLAHIFLFSPFKCFTDF